MTLPVHRLRVRAPVAFLGFVICLYAVVFVLPLILVAGVSIGKGGLVSTHAPWWQSYSDIWGSSYYRGIILHSVLLAGATVLVTLAIGVPLANAVARGSAFMRILVLVAVLNPLFVSVIIRSFGLKILFQYFGVGPSWSLVLVGTVQVMLPFMVLPLVDGVRSIDPSLAQAGRTLGASRTMVAVRIVLPNLVPAITAGAVLVFVLSMNIFSIPLVLGRPQDPTLALVIYQSALAEGDFRLAAAGGISLLAVALVGIAFLSRSRSRAAFV